eukprot:1160679-Pelagomonas_calceolata.AAC.16
MSSPQSHLGKAIGAPPQSESPRALASASGVGQITLGQDDQHASWARWITRGQDNQRSTRAAAKESSSDGPLHWEGDARAGAHGHDRKGMRVEQSCLMKESSSKPCGGAVAKKSLSGWPMH